MGQKNLRDVERHAALLNAMSNPKRLELLSLISSKEWKVGDLAEELNLSQSALSQHLAKLRSEKLVTTRRDAQTIFYSCLSESVLKILAALEDLGETDMKPAALRTVA